MKCLTGLLIFCLFEASDTRADERVVVSTKAKIDWTQRLGRFERIIQEGDNPRNRFIVHRVVRVDRFGNPIPSKRLYGAIILIPGSGTNFSIYDPLEDTRFTAAYLALRGIDVYGYSPRATLLPKDFCDQDPDKCNFLKNWDINGYLRDIDFIRKLAADNHSGKLPIVAGGSWGAILTFGALNQHPKDYVASVIAEGFIFTKNPKVTTTFKKLCMEASQPNFPSFINEGQVIKRALDLKRKAPFEKSPFDPWLNNKQYFYSILTSPDPKLGQAPGYVNVAGDKNGFTYADPGLVESLFGGFNDYDPGVIFRDMYCGWAGDLGLVTHLSQFDGPTLAVIAGRGFGKDMFDNLDLLRSSDKTVLLHERFGHADFLVHPEHQRYWEIPLWNWIQSKVLPLWKSR